MKKFTIEITVQSAAEKAGEPVVHIVDKTFVNNHGLWQLLLSSIPSTALPEQMPRLKEGYDDLRREYYHNEGVESKWIDFHTLEFVGVSVSDCRILEFVNWVNSTFKNVSAKISC